VGHLYSIQHGEKKKQQQQWKKTKQSDDGTACESAAQQAQAEE
jgi:hypothetical protein